MSLFYNDKVVLTCRWVVNYLVKYNCNQYLDTHNNIKSFRTVPVSILELRKKTSHYSIENIVDACKILEEKKQIIYQSKNGIPEDSIIVLQLEGREAYKTSLYSKILIKKWVKRGLILLGVIATILGMGSISKKSAPPSTQQIPKDTLKTDTIKSR